MVGSKIGCRKESKTRALKINQTTKIACSGNKETGGGGNQKRRKGGKGKEKKQEKRKKKKKKKEKRKFLNNRFKIK